MAMAMTMMIMDTVVARIRTSPRLASSVVVGVVVMVMAQRLLVRMVAIDDMGGHVLMQETRHGLDSQESANEAAHHGEAGRLIVPLLTLKVVFRLGQHAVERREKLRRRQYNEKPVA